MDIGLDRSSSHGRGRAGQRTHNQETTMIGKAQAGVEVA